MKFRLVYAERAARDISKLDPQTKDRIKEALERYSENPLHYAKKMVDSALGTYRFRIGDHRVIFDIEGSDYSSPARRPPPRYLPKTIEFPISVIWLFTSSPCIMIPCFGLNFYRRER